MRACVRACVRASERASARVRCVCVNFRQQLRSNGASVIYNRYFDNSQRLLRSVLVWVLNPNPLPFPYQQTHAPTCLFPSPDLTYQRKAFTTTSLRLAYKNSIGVCVGACTGFPSIKLDLSNGYQGYCIQGTVWAQVSGVQVLF